MRKKKPNSLQQLYRNGLLLLFIFMAPALIAGCYGPEEKKRRFFAKGEALQAAGDTVKARLEYKNALQIDPNFHQAYYALGEIAFDDRKYKEAYKYLAKAVQIHPDHLPSQVMLGKLFLIGKAVDRAREKAEWVLHRQPDHPDALLLNAAVQLAEKDDENARLQLENIRMRGIIEPDLYVMLASIHTRRNDYEAAAAVVLEGIAANPGSSRLLTLLARIYDLENRSEIAVETIRKVIRIEPQESSHRVNLADLLWKAGRRDEARRELTELAAYDPVEVDNVVRVAHFFISKNQLADAETVLKNGIRKVPKSFKLRLQLSELYLNTGRPEAAIGLLDDSLRIEKDPADPGVLQTKIALAKLYLLQNDLDSAIKYVNEVLAEAPNNIDGHYIRGGINLLKGEGINAVSEFRTVINEKPEFLDGYLRLSEAHLLNREFELAADTLQNALAIDDKSTDVLIALASVYAAKKDLDSALLQLDKVLDFSPDHYPALSLRADLLAFQRRFEMASRTYRRMIEIQPHNPRAYYRLGQMQMKRQQDREALSTFTAGYRQNPAASGLLSALVQLNIRRGAVDEALALCRRHLVDRPEDAVGYYLLGEAQSAAGDLAAAETSYQKAIDRKSEWQPPHTALARLYIRRNERDLALARIGRALEINPDNPSAYLSLAYLYQLSGDYHKAIQTYEKALAVKPNLWPAANNVAYLLSEYDGSQSALLRALNYIQIAQSAAPEDPAVLDTQGWIYHKLGYSLRALGLIEKALQKDPENPIFNAHAGMIYYRTGYRVEAKEKLQKALESDDRFPGREEVEKLVQEFG
ncbi:MAG: hypothetical protein AMJ54_08640 [Deltaproteobacteria bacterium SG8_13]|nr:MAG: hypothetical protein AMJ54_08640 [Deltaproteobacteria bacterium SG8_13]